MVALSNIKVERLKSMSILSTYMLSLTAIFGILKSFIIPAILKHIMESNRSVAFISKLANDFEFLLSIFVIGVLVCKNSHDEDCVTMLFEVVSPFFVLMMLVFLIYEILDNYGIKRNSTDKSESIKDILKPRLASEDGGLLTKKLDLSSGPPFFVMEFIKDFKKCNKWLLLVFVCLNASIYVSFLFYFRFRLFQGF